MKRMFILAALSFLACRFGCNLPSAEVQGSSIEKILSRAEWPKIQEVV